MSKTLTALAAAGLGIALAASPAAAQQPPSDDQVKALIAQVLAQSGQQDPRTPVAQLVVPTGPTVNLTEQEAVARAAERNLTLISERITPLTWDFSMAATRASYAPTLTSQISSVDAKTLNQSAFAGGLQTESQTQSWSAGLQQNMWRWGGNYSLNWSNNRSETTSTGAQCRPCYQTGLVGTFVQPLWRDRAIDNVRATILSNEISQSIADINLTGQEAAILAQVRNAYWELVYARQAVEAARLSLDLATKLVADNRSRVEIGSMAPIDIVQAQAEEANRRTQLVTAEATLRNNELALKRLIVSGTDDELWNATIVPADRPIVSPMAVDLEGAVRNALSRRTDLAVSRKNLEAAEITLRSLNNQTLPQLNVTGIMDLAGRGGIGIPRRDPITDELIVPPTATYFDALGNISTFEAPTWTVRLNFSYPIGTSAARANYSRQRLLRQQTQASIKTTELQIATEVTAAALAVRNSLEAMQAATTSRQLSEERLKAAESKFEVGMATNYEVVQAQRDLNDARNSELRQQLNYQRAIVDFQRVQITR